MLIETLATARASSLSLEVLGRGVLGSYPILKVVKARSDGKTNGDSEEDVAMDDVVEREKEEGAKTEMEWMAEFERVLLAGCAEDGVFGRVESSWKNGGDVKDNSHPQHHSHANTPSLSTLYFYLPANDPDKERAALMCAVMPRASKGKRAETRKYKQYYWRPVGKQTRWDEYE